MELKDQIIKYVQDNKDEFQLVNSTIEHFKEYIYDSKGEYLFGGDLISKWISKFISLYVDNK